MPERVDLADLDEQYPPESYDWVGVTPPNLPNGEGEPVWEKVTEGSSLGPDELLPTACQLHIVASDLDQVRTKLGELGYDPEGFVE